MQRRDLDGPRLPAELDDLDLDPLRVAALAEAGRHARGEEQVLVAAVAVDQGEGSLVAHGAQVREPLAVAAQVAVLAFFASDDDLEVRPRPDVPADLEQHDVVEVVVAPAPARPQIGELGGVLGVREEAAPARGWA